MLEDEREMTVDQENGMCRKRISPGIMPNRSFRTLPIPKSARPYSSPHQCPRQHRHLVASFLSRLGTIAEVLLFDGTSAIHLACVQRHRGTPHFPPGRCARRLSPLKGPELSHRLPESQ